VDRRSATVDTGRHVHVVDGQTVATLDVPQLIPKLRRRRRPIVGIARHCVFDRGGIDAPLNAVLLVVDHRLTNSNQLCDGR
jgi:hypothetical protein